MAMREHRRSPSVQDAFRGNFLAVSLVSLVVFAAFLYWILFMMLKDETLKSLESDRDFAECIVEDFVNTHSNHIASLATNHSIRNSLASFCDARNDPTVREMYLAEIEKDLDSYFLASGQLVIEIVIVDMATGKCILDQSKGNTPIAFSSMTGRNMYDEPIMIRASQKLTSLPFLYNNRLGLVTLTQAAPIQATKDNLFVIIQHVDVSILALEMDKMLNDADRDWTIRIFTQSGTDINPMDTTPIMDRSDITRNLGVLRAIAGEHTLATYKNDKDVLVFGSFSMMKNKTAIIVAELPYSIFLDKPASVGVLIVGPLIGLILLIIIISSHLARKFSLPVIQLVARCREIAEGDWERMVKIAGVREFELLGNSFNAMARDLSTSFSEREKITQSLEEANRLLVEKMSELEEGEKRYRDLYERSQDGLFTFDSEMGLYTMFNRKFCEILGYGFEEMRQISIESIIPSEERAYAEEQRNLRSKGENLEVPYELYVKRKNGEFRYVEVYSQPVPGSNTISGSIRDVTERVMLEKDIIEKNVQLEHLNESLESLVQERTQTLVALKEIHEKIIANVPVGVIVVEQNLTISFANEQMTEIWGDAAKVEPLLGSSLSEHQEILPEGMVTKIKDCLTGKDFYFPQVKYASPVSEDVMYLDIWAVPLLGSDKNIEGALILVADQTKHVLLRSELINSTRLAATGQLAASLAHEINNPLNSIRYNLELAKMDLEDQSDSDLPRITADLLTYLKTINREIDRIGDIVRNLLDLHRTPKTGPMPIDLNLIISDVLILMKKQILEEGVEVEFKPDDDQKDVSGATGPIKQIVLNMVINSLQAIGNKGKIVIKTGHNDKFGFFSISDNGVGIAEDLLPRIFEPFFSTKGMSGVGLGLAVCESIVNQYRGKILVDSELDVGTTFTVFLPLSETDGD